MTTQALRSSLPAGDHADGAYNPSALERQQPLREVARVQPVQSVPSVDARPAGFGDPSAPTLPSARRLRERAMSAPEPPAFPMPAAAPPWSGTPEGDVGLHTAAAPDVPITYAPAEPTESETHLTPPEQPTHGEVYIPLPSSPHPLYRAMRQWACAFIPALVGAATLLLAFQLALAFPALGDSLERNGGMGMLLTIYLLSGVLYGLTLYFAPRDAIWFVTLTLGAALLPAVMLVALLGPLAGGVADVLLVVLAGIYLWAHRLRVEPETALITRMFGRPFRALLPRRHLLLPFERIATSVGTEEHSFTTPTQYVELRSPSGAAYRARAACTATYAILPGEAYRILSIQATWERDLRRLLMTMLGEALTDWGTQVLALGGVPAQGMLARAVLGEARAWAFARGIWLMRVRVHNIWLEPAALSLAASPGEVDPIAPLDEPMAAAQRAFSRPRAVPASRPRPATPVSADVLASAYEAVREGRIADPTTIREISQAFAHVAASPASETPFPYDAATAARILWEYADQLEQPMAPSPGVPSGPSG